MTALYQVWDQTDRPLAGGPDAPVHIAQIEWEFQQVLGLYLERAPRRVLELGTFEGGTLYHWLQNAPPGATVVTVDSLVAAPDHRYLFEDWTPPDVACHAIIGDTHDPVTQARVKTHGPFDWLFIDALHVYEDTKADFEDYRKMLAPGAVVLFHDICLVRDYPEDGTVAGVSQLWAELQRQGYVTQEFVADPNQDQYGIGCVYL